jgi:hypothetical protein
MKPSAEPVLLKESIRSCDYAARRGEEFILILPNRPEDGGNGERSGTKS